MNVNVAELLDTSHRPYTSLPLRILWQRNEMHWSTIKLTLAPFELLAVVQKLSRGLYWRKGTHTQ